MEDREIIDLYWSRDEAAIAETEKAHGGKLFGLSFRILQNRQDAEENVSDTYLRTWEAIPPQRPKYLLAFLQKICRNLALDRLDWRGAAKRNAELVALTAEMELCIPDTRRDTEWERKEIGQALEAFLGKLPKQSRLIFLRRYLFADSIKEIAQRYGISESKVKMQLHRTREKLRDHLEKEDICV